MSYCELPTFRHAAAGRIGQEKRLKRCTVDKARKLVEHGAAELAVICPGFAGDCLDISEEIGRSAQPA